MKVTTEKQEGQVLLNIEVEPEEVEKAKERAYRRLVNRYVIPGFRRGKAPRAMLERFIGPSVLLNEALTQLVPELYDRAVEEQPHDDVHHHLDHHQAQRDAGDHCQRARYPREQLFDHVDLYRRAASRCGRRYSFSP